jgi:ribonuclease HI
MNYATMQTGTVTGTQTVCYCDGGSRGNGSADAEAYGSYQINDERVMRCEFGHGTNNEAEYKTLRNLLRVLDERGNIGATIYTDSKLMVEQVLGRWKLKAENLRGLRDECARLVEKLDVELVHVGREKIEAKLGH